MLWENKNVLNNLLGGKIYIKRSKIKNLIKSIKILKELGLRKGFFKIFK